VKALPRWFWVVSHCTLLAASLPYLFALAIQPEGTLYLGVHSNFDDHAVYAAWTKQAQEGHIFFENRFTSDAQPGKTVHLYFLAAGWLAKVTGIPLALHLFRVAFGFLFLLAFYRFLHRWIADETLHLPAFLGGIFCAGVGFAFWRNYGFSGPVDVWQPELFGFVSMMQNGLFSAALFLIVSVWNSILAAQFSWKAVWLGALAMLVLTNIHTYDALQIAIVAVGFLAAMIGVRKANGAWVSRSLVIAAGAAPAVAWFIYVRGIDPVFAARADTVTISASLGWVLLGVFPAIVAAMYGLSRHGDKRAVFFASGVLLAVALSQAYFGYRMDVAWASIPTWFGLAIAGAVACYLYRPSHPIYGLLFAWIVMGLIAIYYPGLFQRKLAMGLALPVGICAAIGMCLLLRAQGRRVAFAALALFGLTNLLWLAREMRMATSNLSNTTLHRVYWSSDLREFLKYFQQNSASGDIVIAMPGVAVPDDFQSPREYSLAIPDLNAVISGWGGVQTYAGHWSETPDYLARRQRVMSDLFSPNATVESAYSLLRESGANYVIAPISEIASQAGVPPRDFYTALGEIVYEGDEFLLVRFRPSP
jgi:arabinosyltransferase C